MRRVAVVITARPSYARVKTVLEAVRDRPDLELRLVLAASAVLERPGAVAEVIRNDGFQAAVTVPTELENDDPPAAARSTGLLIGELARVFDRLEPDVILTVADRYETLATAVAAAYLHRPLAHLQGGEVSGSIDGKVRHAVTQLADLHFVANEAARRRVAMMGAAPEAVFVTGCPSIDLAARVHASFDPATFDPFATLGTGQRFDPSRGYLVVLQHPLTTEYEAAGGQIAATRAAVEEAGIPVFWFTPNVDPGAGRAARALRRARDSRQSPVVLVENLPPEDFLRLLLGCRCLLGNSSAGLREAAFLGVPAVNVGGRQAGRERGANVVDVEGDRRQILAAVRRQLDARPAPDELYGDGRAGPRVAELLATAPLNARRGGEA